MKRTIGRRVLMLLENTAYRQDARVPNEADSLREAGYHVSVVCPAQPGHPWHEVFHGVHLYQYPRPPSGKGVAGYMVEYGYAMLAALVLSLIVWLREGVDIVHAHNPPDTFVLIGILFKALGKRFVFDHHDLAPEMYRARMDDGGNRWVYRVLVGFERLSLRVADRVLTTNESHRAIEVVRGGIPREKVLIVRNSPNLRRVRLMAEDADLRARAKLIIGYLGELGPQDGVDYLLRAVARLAGQGRDVYCVIMGDGAMLEASKQQANELGIAERVEFTGWVPWDGVLGRYISTADICVEPAPSNEYNDRCTMVKLMEYMAIAKPVVAFDLPEHRVTAGDSAVYARANDAEALAQAIAELADDPARRARMAALGRARIENELSWTHQREQLLSAYAALSAAKPRSAMARSSRP